MDAKKKNVLAAILAALLIAGSAYVIYLNFKAHNAIKHGR